VAWNPFSIAFGKVEMNVSHKITLATYMITGQEECSLANILHNPSKHGVWLRNTMGQQKVRAHQALGPSFSQVNMLIASS
jgi:hypothetical protein